MPSIIRKSPDLLGGRYFCAGATNRYLVSCRDSRKIVYINSANFGSILSTAVVAYNPGALCYLTSTVHCICEDGYLRKYALTGDTLSAVVSTVNAYTQSSTWIFTHGVNFVCPWGWDGVQIMTHVGTAVVTQRASGLARVQNAYLVGDRLYCFDGNGKGVVLTISGSTITLGEQFTIPSGTNVDCIGLVSSTVLGIGANTNPQYITLDLTDPDAPVWASRTLEDAPIGAVTSAGALISTDEAPLSSDVGGYQVNGGDITISQAAPFDIIGVNAAIIYSPSESSPVTAPPIIVPVSGTIIDTTPVSITCPTLGAVIYFTIDGTQPTLASPVYSAPFTLVDGSRIVKAFAKASLHLASATVTAVYNVTVSVPPLYNFNSTLLETGGLHAFTVTSGVTAYAAPYGGGGSSISASGPSTTAILRSTYAAGGSQILSIAGWFKRLRPGGSVSWFTVSQGANLIQSNSPSGDGNTMNAQINGVNTTNFTPGSGAWAHCAYSMNMATGLFSSWLNGVQTQTLVAFTPAAQGSIIADLTVISYGEDWGIDNFHLGETFLTTSKVVAMMNYVDS